MFAAIADATAPIMIEPSVVARLLLSGERVRVPNDKELVSEVRELVRKGLA